MALYHTPVKEVCLLLMLYHTKDRVDLLQPIFQLTEFQVLDTTRCSYQLYILNALRQRKAIQLAHVCNAIVGKEPFQIAVKTTALKESVPQ